MGDRDAAVREELGRVLASETFLTSPMLSAFLRYVVEETLAGRDDRLKAYSIAVGALGRPHDFDANENPLVRVQARRLRQALQRHYEARGDDADLRIDLPLGTYVPVFRKSDTATPLLPAIDDEAAPPRPLAIVDTEPEPAAPPSPRTSMPARRPMLAVLVTVALTAIVLIGVFVVRRDPSPPPTPAPALISPKIGSGTDVTSPKASAERRDLDVFRVLPLLAVEVEVRNAALVGFDGEIHRNRIEAFVRRFDDTIVVTRRSPDFPAPVGQPLYRLHVLVDREGAATNLYYRLLHAGDERLLRSGALSLHEIGHETSEATSTTPPDLALVRGFVQLHGAITRDLNNLSDLSAELTCLAHAWNYHLDASAQNHLTARTCLEAVVERNQRLAPALTMLGAMYLSEFRQNINPRGDDPLARAEAMLRTAIRVAPASSAPYQALQNLLLIKGDIAAALLAGVRAIEFNPEDMNAIGGYGSLLARIGRYDEALPLLQRAVADMASPPKWLQFYVFLTLNNLGRTEEADRHVAFFDGTNSSLYLTAVAVRAHRRGDEATATAAITAIAAAEHDFGRDPRAFLHRRGLADEVIDRLMADVPSLAPR